MTELPIPEGTSKGYIILALDENGALVDMPAVYVETNEHTADRMADIAASLAAVYDDPHVLILRTFHFEHGEWTKNAESYRNFKEWVRHVAENN